MPRGFPINNAPLNLTDAAKVINTDTASTEQQPAFSPVLPDGTTKIAFGSTRDGNFEIYVMDDNGANPTQLTTTVGPVINLHPEFSPGGDRIAFHSDRDGDFDVYVADLTYDDNGYFTGASSTPTNLTYDMVTSERWPAWSPKGHRMAFWSGSGNGLGTDAEIYTMSATDGTDKLNLTNNDAGEIAPDWGPAPIQKKLSSQ